MSWTVLVVVSIVMVVGGTIVALVWWKMADRIFPGADHATGQRIELRKRKKDQPDPIVIKGFGQSGGSDGESGGEG